MLDINTPKISEKIGLIAVLLAFVGDGAPAFAASRKIGPARDDPRDDGIGLGSADLERQHSSSSGETLSRRNIQTAILRMSTSAPTERPSIMPSRLIEWSLIWRTRNSMI